MWNIPNEYGQACKDAITAFQYIYESRFAKYFSRVSNLYDRLNSKSHEITDAELQSILTDIPLDLFTAAEELNQIRLELEIMKLKRNDRRVQLTLMLQDEFAAKLKDGSVSKSDAKSYVDNHLLSEMTDYDAVIKIYERVISRVENEISFTKELIMGAKKLWDARVQSSQVNPVSEVDDSLPVYDIHNQAVQNYGNLPKDYIK